MEESGHSPSGADWRTNKYSVPLHGYRGSPEDGDQFCEQGQRAARQNEQLKEFRDHIKRQSEKGGQSHIVRHELLIRSRASLAVPQEGSRRIGQQTRSRRQPQLRHQSAFGREQSVSAADAESVENQRTDTAAEGCGSDEREETGEHQIEWQQQCEQGNNSSR